MWCYRFIKQILDWLKWIGLLYFILRKYNSVTVDSNGQIFTCLLNVDHEKSYKEDRNRTWHFFTTTKKTCVLNSFRFIVCLRGLVSVSIRICGFVVGVRLQSLVSSKTSPVFNPDHNFTWRFFWMISRPNLSSVKYNLCSRSRGTPVFSKTVK